jgi:hypothetical protein
MARKKSNVAEKQPPKQQPQADGMVTITIPMGPPVDASQSHRVHLDGHLRGDAGAAMIRLRTALDIGNYRTNNGKHVHSFRDAMIWLTEEIDRCIALTHEVEDGANGGE